MELVGSVTQLDNVGRIVIPIDHRRALQWKRGDHIQCILEGNKIVLSKWIPQAYCVLCGERKAVRFIGNNGICAECLQELTR